jgi:aspartate carbamoyltransferase regulatory subunit
MTTRNNTTLLVAALENGTVIDHIPSSKLFAVIRLLQLEMMNNAVTVGYNLKSRKMGRKSIIKVANKFFTDDEVNRLSVVAPNVVLNTIRDYEVVEKKTVCLPDQIAGVIRCPNPKCITNNEPMPSRFVLIDREKGLFKCRYCEKTVHMEDIRLCD